MANFDVFNGDADGICALHQLRLAEPAESTLITGVKRDIALLNRVSAAPGDRVTVLDVSLDKNRQALDELLALGVSVTYVDHHFAGDIPGHPRLQATIDTSPDTCTGLLVDGLLHGRFRAWAVVAAFGDNLAERAVLAAEPLKLAAGSLRVLQELGECINYNGYGDSVDDLFFHPAELYRRIRAYADPFEFAENEAAFATLRQGYAADMEMAQAVPPEWALPAGSAYVLPDRPWSRRVSGVFGNRLAVHEPDIAHAILTHKPGGGYVVSVRAPHNRPTGADDLCRRFNTGGGRKSAAGINHLPQSEVERFVASVDASFRKSGIDI